MTKPAPTMSDVAPEIAATVVVERTLGSGLATRKLTLSEAPMFPKVSLAYTVRLCKPLLVFDMVSLPVTVMFCLPSKL